MSTKLASKPLTTIRKGMVVIGTGGYEFRLADVFSHLELVNWIQHLNRKRWMTPDDLEQFIKAVCKAKGWEIDA